MFLLEPELPGPQAIELHAKDMSESENFFCHAIKNMKNIKNLVWENVSDALSFHNIPLHFRLEESPTKTSVE